MFSDLKKFVKAEERRGNSWTPAAEVKFREDTDAIDEMDERIKELLETEARSGNLDQQRGPYESTVRSAPGFIQSDRNLTEDQKELRAFVNGETKAIDVHFTPEVRDLSTVVTTAGGFTVPKSWHKKLYEHMVSAGALRGAGATIVTTTGGEEYHVPKTTSFGTAAIVGEGTALAEADPAFGETILKAWKYGQLLEVTNELRTDNIVNLEDFFARDFGRALGRASGNDYINGNGSNKPTGLVAAAGTAVTATAGGTGVPTIDNLIDVYHSVDPMYRANAVWLMADATAAWIRKLKDTDNNYIWERSIQSGTPDTLLGRPVYVDAHMPAMGTASNRSIAFGDPSAYWIRDVGGVRIEASPDYGFNRDVTTYRGILRSDGNLVDLTGAIKLFSGGTS